MRIAIVGCGYVADYYAATLPNHAALEVAGVYDRDPRRAARFATHYGHRAYPSLEELLADPAVDLVVNLTNPRSHFEVSAAALRAGKHVYTEKPLATDLPRAEELVAMAEARGLQLGSAPCTVLGEAAQTLWKALRQKRIGQPRLVYAEMDDGPIALMDHARWHGVTGAPWPARDEFEVGCTLEHAGYYLTWLTAFFGPARAVVASAHLLQPDKGLELVVSAPDFTVAAIEFESGTVARLTCSIFGSHDHRLRIFGDDGILSMDEAWDFASPVRWSPRTRFGLLAERHPGLARWVGLGPRRLRPVRRARFRWAGRPAARIDFARGIAEVAQAAAERRPSRLSARWSLHVNELTLAIQHPAHPGTRQELRTRFDPLAPMPWAE